MPVGISKTVSLLRGEEAREEPRRRRGDRAKPEGEDEGGLTFRLGSGAASGSLLQAPSFNVLYVSTPRIGLFQTPEFQALAQTWGETLQLLRPLLRFGFPETSLRNKCPYYNEELYATPAGQLLPNDRLRKLMAGIGRGDLDLAGAQRPGHGHAHGAQQQPQQLQVQQQAGPAGAAAQADGGAAGAAAAPAPPPDGAQLMGPFGISTLAFLARQVRQGTHQQQRAAREREEQELEQHPEALIPRSRFLVPDLPSGELVLGLNLAAYWLITKQARRGGLGA